MNMKLVSVAISSSYLILLEDLALFSSNFDRGHFQSLRLRQMDLLSFHIRRKFGSAQFSDASSHLRKGSLFRDSLDRRVILKKTYGSLGVFSFFLFFFNQLVRREDDL